MLAALSVKGPCSELKQGLLMMLGLLGLDDCKSTFDVVTTHVAQWCFVRYFTCLSCNNYVTGGVSKVFERSLTIIHTDPDICLQVQVKSLT